MKKDLMFLEIQSYIMEFATELAKWVNSPMKVPDSTPMDLAEKYAKLIRKMVDTYDKES